MKLISMVAVLAVTSGSAWAQQTANINNLPVDLQGTTEVTEVADDRIAPPKSGVLILNSQTAAGTSRAQSVLQQPTIQVQASPLVESRAEQLRKQRQGAEVATEQKIVEKLEASRLEDEKERAQRLFGDRWERQEPTAQVTQPVVQQPVAVVPAQQAVVNVDESNKEDLNAMKEEILGEIRDAREERLKADMLAQEAKKEENETRYYMGGMLGVTEYDASNVESNGSGGFSVGALLDSGVMVEASFLYSNLYLNQWWRDYDFFKEVDQYNIGMAVKYSPLAGSFKPYAGGAVSYTHRTYTDRGYDYYSDRRYSRSYYDQYPSDEEVTSSSVDFGFLFGLDFFVSKNMAFGAEYRYSMNLFNKTDSPFLDRGDWRAPANTEPLEAVDYSTVTFSGKFLF